MLNVVYVIRDTCSICSTCMYMRGPQQDQAKIGDLDASRKRQNKEKFYSIVDV